MAVSSVISVEPASSTFDRQVPTIDRPDGPADDEAEVQVEHRTRYSSVLWPLTNSVVYGPSLNPALRAVLRTPCPFNSVVPAPSASTLW